MNDESYTHNYIALSILLTLVLYVLLWQLAAHVRVRPFDESADSEKKNRRLTVATVDLRELMAKGPELPREFKDRILDDHRQKLTKLFETAGLEKKPKPRLKPVITRLGRNLRKELPRAERNYRGPRTSPPPEILAIKAINLPPRRRLLPNRRHIPVIKRHLLRETIVPSIVSPKPGGGGYDTENVELGMRLKIPSRKVADFPAPAMPIPAPEIEVPDTGLTDTSETNILDSDLDVIVSVYRDQKVDGGYFQVDISAKESDARIESIPKDLLFLVDSSASIKYQKLKEFKKGMQQALEYIRPDDRFNIVAFRDKPRPLFARFEAPTPASLAQAVKFIDSLRSSGKTDVYAGLAPYVAAPIEAPERPYMIFLLTDGVSTTRLKLADNEFIHRIIRENTSRGSIFAFSVGEESNLFLMDLLSYKNRGLSLHEQRTRDSRTALVSYVGGLSEILVADLECRITGELTDEVYPRELPHLFRNYPLTVFGRFPAATDEIGIQIIGRNKQGTKEELVIRQRLDEAAPAGSDLALRWAAQKIYYLVSERTIRNSPDLQPQIDELAARYNILVPY